MRSGQRPLAFAAALRPQTRCAASQSCGLVNLPPTNAIRQQPQAVVGEVAKAVADALDLLDQQVHGLGGPARAAIGGMPGKDLGLPGPHGAGKARQLRHPDAVSPALEAAPAGARNVATNTVDPSAAVHHGGLVTGDREDGERGPARTCSRQQRPQLIPPGRRVCGWSGTIVRRREGRRPPAWRLDAPDGRRIPGIRSRTHRGLKSGGDAPDLVIDLDSLALDVAVTGRLARPHWPFSRVSVDRPTLTIPT